MLEARRELERPDAGRRRPEAVAERFALALPLVLDGVREREVAAFREWDRALLRGFVVRAFVWLEDFFFPAEPGDFVSPFSRRILFTVRAATSSARPP